MATNGTSPDFADGVAVQLTSITPVRVFNAAGEYFDTEIHLDSSLELIQLAIEDFFHVKPEAQILLHNRRQINPRQSLREAGCLMLKGDPHVKIVFNIKRGPLLNLVCHLSSTHEIFPVACHEQLTVLEVKMELAHEIERKRARNARDQGMKVVPKTFPVERIRLLWRYMELNDKATLSYYRIPTNSSLYVMMKKGSTSEAQERDAGFRPIPQGTAALPSSGENYRTVKPLQTMNQRNIRAVPSVPLVLPVDDGRLSGQPQPGGNNPFPAPVPGGHQVASSSPPVAPPLLSSSPPGTQLHYPPSAQYLPQYAPGYAAGNPRPQYGPTVYNGTMLDSPQYRSSFPPQHYAGPPAPNMAREPARAPQQLYVGSEPQWVGQLQNKMALVERELLQLKQQESYREQMNSLRNAPQNAKHDVETLTRIQELESSVVRLQSLLERTAALVG